MLNRNLSKGVPADIQGLQRIEYDGPKGFGAGDLIPNIVKYLVNDHTHPRNVLNAVSGENKEMKFYFALSALAHLRNNTYLSHPDIRRLSQGTYLRKEGQDQVLEVLRNLGLISSWTTKRGAKLRKNLYPELLKVGK
ncbi:MAG: hypothetical protein ACREUU_02960 [Gammaproteobacteria bacterium]